MNNEFSNKLEKNDNQQSLNNQLNNPNNERKENIIHYGSSINQESSVAIQFNSNLDNQNKTLTNNIQNNNMINNQSITNNTKENIVINQTLGNSNANNNINNEAKEEIKDDKVEKIVDNLNTDFLVLFIISIIGFIYAISQGSFEITYVIELVILIVGYIGSKDKKAYAAVCGIITGVLMILSLSIISIVLGIFIIIRSVKYNKFLKQNGTKTKTLLFSILGIIGVIIITGVAIYIDLYGGHALECTRSNGDTIEVKFDPEGISSLKINNIDAERLDFISYKLNFTNDFFFGSYGADNGSGKIKIYRNIVKEYEEENGSICK